MQEFLAERRRNELENIERSRQAIAELDTYAAQSKNAKGIEKWRGYQFESSSNKTPEFKAFARDYRKALNAWLGSAYTLEAFNVGHFYLSGFIRAVETGKYCYFSISDVRGGGEGFYTSILIRTAKDAKDYTGGMNTYAAFPQLRERVASLLK